MKENICWRTYTGRIFDALAPRAENIHIEDIAHGLACVNRFCGHTHAPYSVAEHSCRMVEALRYQGAPRHVLMWALLHDAAEAFLCDIPRPVKQSEEMAGYHILEEGVMAEIAERFKLEGEDVPQLVKDADAAMLRSEQRDLVCESTGWESGPCLVPPTIAPWPWWRAELKFLETYNALTGASYEMPRHFQGATMGRSQTGAVQLRYADLLTMLREIDELREWRDQRLAMDNARLAAGRAAAQEELATV